MIEFDHSEKPGWLMYMGVEMTRAMIQDIISNRFVIRVFFRWHTYLNRSFVTKVHATFVNMVHAKVFSTEKKEKVL